MQIEQLVERRRHIAGLQPVNRCRREVDAADDDIAGLLACLLEDVGELTGDAAVLGADRLQVGMRLDVGGKDVGTASEVSLFTSWLISRRSTLRPAFSSVSARPFSDWPRSAWLKTP